METSVVLAQFWGWFLIVTTALFLIRGKAFLMEMFTLAENRVFVMLAGFLALMFGLISVILHNVWTMNGEGAVTLFGWMAIFKGLTLIGCPSGTNKMVRSMKRSIFAIQFVLLLGLVIGIWLVWAV
ncbi:MAG: hypothetical protein PHY14_04390 [Candidatus Gracilibacteria bacterium]|nr:hypothetical protein [Candidatus Gracilibacteria bacterium]